MEYERKYNLLLGCRPLDPMVYANFCSDRKILCLKRHFMSVPFPVLTIFLFVSFQAIYMSCTENDACAAAATCGDSQCRS